MRVAANGGTFSVYGDGRQVRDYVNVADVVAAVLVGLRQPGLSGPLVIGSGHSVSVLDLVELVEGALGAKLDVQHMPAKAGEMPAVIVDNSASAALGLEPVRVPRRRHRRGGEGMDHRGCPP